jgi:hypothetical protein
LKDIIIVGGQNIFPEDVEALVNTVPGIYPERVVAFGVINEAHGTEGLAWRRPGANIISADLSSLQREIFPIGFKPDWCCTPIGHPCATTLDCEEHSGEDLQPPQGVVP